MYATHTFFLTRRAAYIVVLDGRREEKAEYWLKLIEIVAPDSPVFLVINKIDENPHYDLNRAELRRRWKNIEGVFPLSCKTDQGLAAFVDVFWQRGQELELPTLRFSSQWARVKDELLGHKEPLLEQTWYWDLCDKNGI